MSDFDALKAAARVGLVQAQVRERALGRIALLESGMKADALPCEIDVSDGPQGVIIVRVALLPAKEG